MVNAYDYFIIAVLQCEAVRKKYNVGNSVQRKLQFHI